MSINEKINLARIKKRMSQAELAYKTGYTIEDIIKFETEGTLVNAYAILQILNAFNLKSAEFYEMNKH